MTEAKSTDADVKTDVDVKTDDSDKIVETVLGELDAIDEKRWTRVCSSFTTSTGVGMLLTTSVTTPLTTENRAIAKLRLKAQFVRMQAETKQAATYHLNLESPQTVYAIGVSGPYSGNNSYVVSEVQLTAITQDERKSLNGMLLPTCHSLIQHASRLSASALGYGVHVRCQLGDRIEQDGIKSDQFEAVVQRISTYVGEEPGDDFKLVVHFKGISAV